MQLKKNALLSPYTTFYIGGPSRYLIFGQDVGELIEAVEFAKDKNLPLLIFGGGSNLLVSDSGFDGVAIRLENIGMDIVNETDEEVQLSVDSGEVWDDVVRFACEEKWWGIENLSHIPGFSGAFSVQNVGAYGQEASGVVVSVEVYDLQDNVIKTLNYDELKFGYRKSIFNTTEKNRYVILSTTLRLQKNGEPNLSYGDLADRFKNLTPTIQEIRDAIIEIRNQKFPFPSEPTKGNSGSFFRGPILSDKDFELMQIKLSETLGHDSLEKLEKMKSRLKVSQGYKTPTAFLIENCVGKELVVGGAKINPNQPAIILNYSGQATSTEVLSLYKQVSSAVFEQTGVRLEIEPELIGFTKGELAEYGVS
ncbi:TPA: UDP-N-acetylenolpyruvoylglucosamine reductase [Patescibacteria group bacterium]|jgi:UDP-N-acetylmuramate dehydrogenase|nr:UDP-N-acetylenolpyruvoylglucosamine reductase [Patescibacteria group bacterium]